VPLETGTLISDLVVTNPAHTDGLNAADGHLRLIKSAILNTFPNINAAVTVTDEQLNAIATALAVHKGVDGSAGAPAYSFTSEATLGLYRAAAGILAFTGVLRGNGAVPAGALQDFAMATAPAGWLACDGQAVSRTTYADLFTAIGTTWGAGDGSTTFNVPPMFDRYRRHRNTGGGNLAGAVGTLQGPLNLTHTHAVSGTTGSENASHAHSFSGDTGQMSANALHSHTYNPPGGTTVGGGGSFGFSSATGGSATSTSSTNVDHSHAYSGVTTTESSVHQHAFSTTTAATGDANESRPYSATVLTCIKI
jgi:microcystin-dependent protein